NLQVLDNTYHQVSDSNNLQVLDNKYYQVSDSNNLQGQSTRFNLLPCIIGIIRYQTKTTYRV
ncbi:hypothetical protein LOTGIDRAFT_113415, partial [Lottia gigantea]